MWIHLNHFLHFCSLFKPDGSRLFSFVTSAPTWEAYISNMAKPGTWGTHLELQAIATMLDVTFCIITNSRAEEQAMFWLFPQWKDSATSDATLLVGCEMEFHFYSLAPSQSRVSDKIHFRSAAQEVICSSASTSVTGNAADCGKPI